MWKKIFKTTTIVLFVVLICMQIVSIYKTSERQHEVNLQFMNSYISLTTNLHNKTLPVSGYALHKLDIENTKCKHTMMLLYNDTSFYKDRYVDDIISTLNLVSGCDAIHEINYSKELNDILNDFGQHLQLDTCTEEISKSTWEALEKTVDFKKVKQAKSYIIED